MLEAQGSFVLGGQAFGLIAFNLVLTFVLGSRRTSPSGATSAASPAALSAMLALSRLGRTHAIYGRPGLLGAAGLIAVGLASVLVAYARVQGVT